MQHRVYKLDTRIRVLGVPPTDLFLIIFTWGIANQIVPLFIKSRFSVVLPFFIAFVVFKLWSTVRDRVPDRFFIHLAGWLSEPDEYRAVPDYKAVPLVLDPKAVRRELKNPQTSLKLERLRAKARTTT